MQPGSVDDRGSQRQWAADDLPGDRWRSRDRHLPRLSPIQAASDLLERSGRRNSVAAGVPRERLGGWRRRIANPAQGGGPERSSMTDWRKRYERDRQMDRAFHHVACLLIPLR